MFVRKGPLLPGAWNRVLGTDMSSGSYSILPNISYRHCSIEHSSQEADYVSSVDSQCDE
jgi:hypothetical protein